MARGGLSSLFFFSFFRLFSFFLFFSFLCRFLDRFFFFLSSLSDSDESELEEEEESSLSLFLPMVLLYGDKYATFNEKTGEGGWKGGNGCLGSSRKATCSSPGAPGPILGMVACFTGHSSIDGRLLCWQARSRWSSPLGDDLCRS